MNAEENYLTFLRKQFLTYKELAEKAIRQIPDTALFYQSNEESNSIAMIIQHMSGNMLSRWTDFLTKDGEKDWRKRDEEFEIVINTKQEMMRVWESGWQCLFAALNSLQPDQMQQTIYIRKEAHTVLEAINRQIAHYSYHVGQIVFIAKMHNDQFISLSIPKKKN